ncbi:MAG TPA: M20/M25/M40 family metallo-hydrolase [Myxococcaceae bacterium]|nr:M20/M25/M40 family metallo-hydrolase [Myxococcaceae bacterium]
MAVSGTMPSTRTALVLGLTLTGASLAAQTAPADPRAALKHRAEGETPLISDTFELCDRVGGRITGSTAMDRAIRWGTDKLKAAGVDSVDTEPFTVPFLWMPGSVEVAVTAPETFPLRAVAAPGTASTQGSIEAKVVDVGLGLAADWAKAGIATSGAIALVHTKEMKTFDDLFDEYFRAGPLLKAAAQAQVRGLVIQSTRPRGLLYQHPMVFGRSPGTVPVALVSREQADRVAWLADRTEVRMRLDVVNRIGPMYDALNVVGEIRGKEKPEEVVVIGAHLDSWALGTGAEDNGVNAALVIDVARAFKELGLQPRRTVRFVLFAGEEQGMWGSAGYVERHKGELDRHAGVVIFDVGSGRTRGFYVSGRPELRPVLARALSGYSGMGAAAHSLDGVDGTDNFDFLLSGVPTFVADQDPAPYLPDYHAESDVPERINVKEARRNAGLAATLVWSLANSPAAIPKRQTRAEVDALLVKTKLVEQMQGFDQWEDWKAGRRGFPAGP